jgi:hypothetical protein
VFANPVDSPMILPSRFRTGAQALGFMELRPLARLADESKTGS